MSRVASFFSLAGLALAVGCQPASPPEHVSILHLRRDQDVLVAPDVLTLAKTDHVVLLKQGLKTCAAVPVRGYTCTFRKQEKLGGRLRKEQHVDVKFRRQPFSVAMTWTKNPPLGDAMLYVAGRYPDSDGRSRMLVRPKKGLQWLVGSSVLRRPDGPDAMRNTLRPCTKFGFANGLASLIEVYEQALAREECEMQYGGVTDVGGRACLVLRRILPAGKGYPARITETCLDIETLLPLRIVGYDDDGSLQCDYEYHDVTINPGLTDKDFTPQANGIAPPKTK